jgi:uncharacterized protein YybS (DUF2232 family)
VVRLGPEAVRSVLLGTGLGLGLLLLAWGAPGGVWSGATALVSLVPVALAVTLGGPGAAILTGLVGVGGTAVLLGGSAALALVLREGLPGLALGTALARRLSVPMSLIAVAATSLVGLLALLEAVAPTGTSPFVYLERQIDAHVASLEALPGRLGVSEDPGWAADSARVVATTMRVAGPGILVLGVVLGAAANYVAARLCLRGAGFRPFGEEKVPDHLVWSVIVGGLLIVSREATLVLVGVNLLIVLTPLYAIQGLAVFRHFFQRVRVPRLLQGLSFALFAMQPLLLVAVAGVGLSDLWIDFRKIRQAPTPA